MGRTEMIGYENSYNGALMDAIYEHAGLPAYNNPCPVAGTAGCGATVTSGSKSQFMFVMDAIVHF